LNLCQETDTVINRSPRGQNRGRIPSFFLGTDSADDREEDAIWAESFSTQSAVDTQRMYYNSTVQADGIDFLIPRVLFQWASLIELKLLC